MHLQATTAQFAYYFLIIKIKGLQGEYARNSVKWTLISARKWHAPMHISLMLFCENCWKRGRRISLYWSYTELTEVFCNIVYWSAVVLLPGKLHLKNLHGCDNITVIFIDIRGVFSNNHLVSFAFSGICFIGALLPEFGGADHACLRVGYAISARLRAVLFADQVESCGCDQEAFQLLGYFVLLQFPFFDAWSLYSALFILFEVVLQYGSVNLRHHSFQCSLCLRRPFFHEIPVVCLAFALIFSLGIHCFVRFSGLEPEKGRGWTAIVVVVFRWRRRDRCSVIARHLVRNCNWIKITSGKNLNVNMKAMQNIWNYQHSGFWSVCIHS